MVLLKIAFFKESKTRPEPVKIISLNETKLSREDVIKSYECLAKGQFRPGSYDIVDNNCIDFARALSVKLVGHELPDEYQNVVRNKIIRTGIIAGTILPAIVLAVNFIVDAVLACVGGSRRARKRHYKM